MKRLICMILLLLLLSGCGLMENGIKDPVTFYYINKDYQKNMDSVIDSEIREASGHRDDLPYLLALYSMGPSSEELISPFPVSTRIIPTEHTEAGIVLSLSEIPDSMTDAEYTLASTCLALTCMELIDASQITVISEGRSVSINTENIILSETIHKNQPEVEK